MIFPLGNNKLFPKFDYLRDLKLNSTEKPLRKFLWVEARLSPFFSLQKNLLFLDPFSPMMKVIVLNVKNLFLKDKIA